MVWFVKLPDEPVTVTVNAPTVAVALAVKVNVLVVVAGFVLNDAVTPLGRPDADRLTLPLLTTVSPSRWRTYGWWMWP